MSGTAPPAPRTKTFPEAGPHDGQPVSISMARVLLRPPLLRNPRETNSMGEHHSGSEATYLILIHTRPSYLRCSRQFPVDTSTSPHLCPESQTLEAKCTTGREGRNSKSLQHLCDRPMYIKSSSNLDAHLGGSQLRSGADHMRAAVGIRSGSFLKTYEGCPATTQPWTPLCVLLRRLPTALTVLTTESPRTGGTRTGFWSVCKRGPITTTHLQSISSLRKSPVPPSPHGTIPAVT